METMTLEQREKFINERVCEILRAFSEFQGKDISNLSIQNRDKYIEGRIASDLAISDDLLIQMRKLLELYETHVQRASNTAALLFLINGIDLECMAGTVDVIAKIESKNVKSNDAA